MTSPFPVRSARVGLQVGDAAVLAAGSSVSSAGSSHALPPSTLPRPSRGTDSPPDPSSYSSSPCWSAGGQHQGTISPLHTPPVLRCRTSGCEDEGRRAASCRRLTRDVPLTLALTHAFNRSCCSLFRPHHLLLELSSSTIGATETSCPAPDPPAASLPPPNPTQAPPSAATRAEAGRSSPQPCQTADAPPPCAWSAARSGPGHPPKDRQGSSCRMWPTTRSLGGQRWTTFEAGQTRERERDTRGRGMRERD